MANQLGDSFQLLFEENQYLKGFVVDYGTDWYSGLFSMYAVSFDM